jgi:hypothetical protein
MAQTYSESLRPPELTQAQKIEAIARKSILDDYFKKLNEGVSSFLEQQNLTHQLAYNDEGYNTTLINIPARIPTEFIASIQPSLDRHLGTARDAYEFNQLVTQEFAHVLRLLDIFTQEMRNTLDVMARNSEVPYMPDQNFSFSPDLKEFLTT